MLPSRVSNPGPIRTCEDVAFYGLCEYENFVGSVGKVKTMNWPAGLPSSFPLLCPETCERDSLGPYPYGSPEPGEGRLVCGPGGVCEDRDRKVLGAPANVASFEYTWWSHWQCTCPEGAAATCVVGTPCTP